MPNLDITRFQERSTFGQVLVETWLKHSDAWTAQVVSHLLPCHFLLEPPGSERILHFTILIASLGSIWGGSPCLILTVRGLKTSTWQEISKQLLKGGDVMEFLPQKMSSFLHCQVWCLASFVGWSARCFRSFSACNLLHLVEEEMVERNRILKIFFKNFLT